MELRETISMQVLKENIFGELEWRKERQVSLGSCKHPNKKIRAIKFYPDVEII